MEPAWAGYVMTFIGSALLTTIAHFLYMGRVVMTREQFADFERRVESRFHRLETGFVQLREDVVRISTIQSGGKR